MPDLAINNVLKTEVTFVRKMIQEYGHRQLLKKNQYFCCANSSNSLIAYVVKGGLKYCCHDYRGKEQILSFAFDGELIGSYLAWQTGNKSLYDIQAIEATELFYINIKELSALLTIFDFKISVTRFVEVIAFEILRKIVSIRCQSPEQSYLQLLSRVPDILERTTLRNVASYLSITPEALSRMRTKMLKDD